MTHHPLRGKTLWGRHVHYGEPIDRAWLWWHTMLGLGAGLLSWPSVGVDMALVVLFLWSSTTALTGLLVESRKLVSRGMLMLSVACALRAVAIWNTDQHGVGSSAIATFTWGMLALGNGMEACAVKHRGVSSRWWYLGQPGNHPESRSSPL